VRKPKILEGFYGYEKENACSPAFRRSVVETWQETLHRDPNPERVLEVWLLGISSLAETLPSHRVGVGSSESLQGGCVNPGGPQKSAKKRY
jgi:hypothetical protein